MGKIFMLIWSLAMLCFNIKAYKDVYIADRNELNAKGIAAIEKAEKDGSKSYLTSAIIIAFAIDLLFWLIATASFTSPFVILYGCIVISYGIYSLFATLKFIEDKKAPKQIMPYVLIPLNTIFIIGYIILLLF